MWARVGGRWRIQRRLSVGTLLRHGRLQEARRRPANGGRSAPPRGSKVVAKHPRESQTGITLPRAPVRGTRPRLCPLFRRQLHARAPRAHRFESRWPCFLPGGRWPNEAPRRAAIRSRSSIARFQARIPFPLRARPSLPAQPGLPCGTEVGEGWRDGVILSVRRTSATRASGNRCRETGRVGSQFCGPCAPQSSTRLPVNACVEERTV